MSPDKIVHRPPSNWRSINAARPSSTRRDALLFLADAAVKVVDDHTGQPLVVHEEALADRIGILLGHRDFLAQDFFRADAAVDKALDVTDPVLDDLRLVLQIRLGTLLAVTRHDGVGVERLDALQRREPFPGIAFL